jgi:hypothetical protein
MNAFMAQPCATAVKHELIRWPLAADFSALRLRSTSKPLMLAALQPGAEPERISDAGQGLAWFEAERRVLMAATGRALEAGFDARVTA